MDKLVNQDYQKEIFNIYTEKFIERLVRNNDLTTKEKINMLQSYKDKQSHSIFVLEEAMLINTVFTDYNMDFKKLLSLQSLCHDIGRFKQMELTSTFRDSELETINPMFKDHGDLGAYLIVEEGLMKLFSPDTTIYNDIVSEVIKRHSKKTDSKMLDSIILEYIEAFKNYDLYEMLLSKHTSKEKEVLIATNTAIVQDADRLDIFRKIIKGIWVPAISEEKIPLEVWEMFKNGNLSTISKLKMDGLWNSNVGHLVRLSFIEQTCLVPELKKIRDEKLIERIYEQTVKDKPGDDILYPAYEMAEMKLERLINKNSSNIIVRK